MVVKPSASSASGSYGSVPSLHGAYWQHSTGASPLRSPVGSATHGSGQFSSTCKDLTFGPAVVQQQQNRPFVKVKELTPFHTVLASD